ncbi:G2-specific serine/threonine protein kinase, partial [Teratosphaeriaceae sp. CCFEE 6253]
MSEREKNQLAAELDILKTLRHPNVVQYYSREHIKSTSDIHLYMEYCGNGDLGGYIKKLRDRNVLAEEDFVWSIFAQLVGALYRCHYGEDTPPPAQEVAVRQGKVLQSKQGHRVILHRDLKPEN